MNAADREIERLRKCRAKHPTNPTVGPCVLDRDHEGKHYFDLALTLAEERDTAEAEVARLRRAIDHYVGALGIEKQRREAAEAEVARLREERGRVEALFAGGPDTPCRTTWWGNPGPGLVECVEVPVDDLRAALAPRESATEAPRTRDGEQGGER